MRAGERARNDGERPGKAVLPGRRGCTECLVVGRRALHVGKKRTSKPIFSAASESFLSAQTKVWWRGRSLHQANAAASCRPSAELSECGNSTFSARSKIWLVGAISTQPRRNTCSR